MKRFAVILSGSFNRFIPADYIICADGGYDYAVRQGLHPNLVVGDMDSIVNLPDVDTVKVPSEKDYSDGELAVRQAALKGALSVDIYGATGGRIDHVMYNMHLLSIAKNLGIAAVLRGDNYDGYICDKNLLLTANVGDTVSIVPFGGEAHIIKTKGLKYPADDITLTSATTVGLSNVAIDTNVFVSVDKGSVIVFRLF